MLLGSKNDAVFRRILWVCAEITRGVHHGHRTGTDAWEIKPAVI